ncbi:MAG: hypothetical protein WBZ36_08810 [Candidatus Nitrosopolaris sp.]
MSFGMYLLFGTQTNFEYSSFEAKYERSHRDKLKGLQVLSDPFLIKYPVMSGNMMGFVIRDIHSFLKHMEEAFVDEIIALYYMNLYNDSNTMMSHQSNVIILSLLAYQIKLRNKACCYFSNKIKSFHKGRWRDDLA